MTAVWLLGSAGCLSILLSPSAFGSVPAGAAEITLPGQLTPLHSGGSATPYGVALPQDARCPGDSAHKGYHVFSYLVPKGESPATVTFTDLPRQGLGYFANGVYVGAINTAEYTGQIVGLPTEFTWSRLTPHLLFSSGGTTATWNGGIACADSEGVTTDYWNTQIVFTASTTDPGGFTWSVPATIDVSSSSHTGLWVGTALIVVAVVLSGLVIGFKRRSATEGAHGQP